MHALSFHWPLVLLLRHYIVFNSFVAPQTLAHQAPLSMEFPRQGYWSELSFPFPGGLPNPGIKPKSPNWQADSFSFVVGVKVVFMIRPFYTTMLGLKLSVKNDSELHLWGPGAHCYFLKHQYMLLKERSWTPDGKSLYGFPLCAETMKSFSLNELVFWSCRDFVILWMQG